MVLTFFKREDEALEEDHNAVQIREANILGALKGSAPQDFILKCLDCGDRFTFTVGEQQFL
ncbi:hypothetical protein GH741_02515 [Aquibacillus halophilus]|uniref:Probable zinc-binding domain-containing protein n=2 Tax=Aquibacillus halophilus TaxID=930132 RepID=A0A6A8D724_9BACI|nr:zinc-ribbon domain containing protein [Aquibacillus halophilus]MRH41545.1 hypothetical protein [Aquibacillus halophilus]